MVLGLGVAVRKTTKTKASQALFFLVSSVDEAHSMTRGMLSPFHHPMFEFFTSFS